MFSKVIDKLKKKKKKLQTEAWHQVIKNREEEKSVDVSISKEDTLYKMTVSDFMPIADYVERLKTIDEFGIYHMISNSVLWNSSEQKVNKGTYYALAFDNFLYNIHLDGDKILIDERIKYGVLTEERIIDYNIRDKNFRYFSAKHDKGDTFYTRYYSNNGPCFGNLDYSSDEAYEEISGVISNLEDISQIKKIIDVQLLKIDILGNINANSIKNNKLI